MAPQLGVSQAQIDAALGEHNAVSAAGDLAIGPQRIRIVPKGAADSVAAIGNIVGAGGGDQLIFPAHFGHKDAAISTSTAIDALNCNQAIHRGQIHVESAERLGAA